MIEVLIYIAILATTLPFGYYLAWLCNDELVADRKYFYLMILFLTVIAILSVFFYFESSILLTFVYMLFVLLVMIYKSKDKRFVKIR